MKKRYIIGVMSLCICFSLFLAASHFISWGVMKSNLESDTRKSQKIDESWKVVSHTTDKIAAFLFYNESLNDCRYFIYTNNDGLSFGYFLREEGNLSDLEGIQGFSYEEDEILLSMNQVNAVKVERAFENAKYLPEIHEVIPGQPFAVSFPNAEHNDGGTISIYDKEGTSIAINGENIL